MAYGLKYISEVRSRSGQDWRIGIYKKSHAAGSTALTLYGADGFVLSYNGEGDEIHEPIKASDLKFAVTGTTTTIEVFAADIISGATNDFIVKLEKWNPSMIPDPGYEFYWGGTLTHEVTEIPDQYQYVVEVTAIDGLSSLQSIEKTITDVAAMATVTSDYYIRPSVLMSTILQQVPWVSTFMPTFTIKWSDNWYPVGLATTYWQNALYINLKVFATYNERTNRYDLNNFYDIMQEVLLAFNSEIFIGDGNWTIINKDYRRVVENRDAVYFSGTTVVGTSLDATQYTITQSGVTNSRLSGGRFMYKQPVKIVRKKITYKSNSDANNNRTIYDQFANIELDRVGTTYIGTGDLNCEDVSADDISKFKISWDLNYRMQTNAAYGYNGICTLAFMVKITSGGITYYLSGATDTNAEFTLTPSVFYMKSTPTIGVIDSGDTLYDGKLIGEFTVQLPFATGIVDTIISLDYYSFQLIGAAYSESDTVDFFAGGANGYLYIEPLTAGNENTTGYVTFASASTNGNDLIYQLPDGIIHDGSTSGGIFYNNNTGALSIIPATIARTTKWYDRAVGTSSTLYLAEMACYSLHRYTYKALRLYSGSVMNPNINYNDTIAISYDGSTISMVFNGGQYSGRQDRWTGEWWTVLVEVNPAIEMVTADDAPFVGIDLPRAPQAHPYTLGNTSKIDDHFLITNNVLEYKTQAQGTIMAAPAGTNGYPTYREVDLGELKLKGNSTGYSVLKTANTGTRNFDITLQAGAGTVAFLSDVGSSGGGFTGTRGSVPFVGTSGTLVEDNANFFYDNTNERLGLGLAAPTHRVTAAGTAAVDGIRSWMGFDVYPVPPPTTLTMAAGTGAGVDVGTHYYLVTFVNDIGETSAKLSSAIVLTTGTQAVTVNIPVSTDFRVTSRKIYRTKANTAATADYLLATVSNNTATSYLDTIADSSLTDGPQKGYFRGNTTAPQLTLAGQRVMQFDTETVALGVGATGTSFVNLTAGRFVVIGYLAGRALTTALYPNLIGYQCGYNAQDASTPVGYGYQALYGLTNGTGDIGIGYQAAYNNATGDYNIAIGGEVLKGTAGTSFSNCIGIGYRAGYGNNGNNNVFIGHSAGYLNSTGSSHIHIGYFAGRYETGSAKLIIDSFNRTNEANQRAQAIIYGVLHGTPASQILSLGGTGKVGINQQSPTSTFHITGSESHTRAVATAAYTLGLADYYLECTGTTSYSVRLPAVASCDGRFYELWNSGTGTTTIDPDGTELIDGATTKTLTPGFVARIYSDGAKWYSINKLDSWKFGTGTNYAEFEPDGTLKLNGEATVWVDIDFPIIIRSTGANIPVIGTIKGNITGPQWTVDDYAIIEPQEFIHAWKEGSPVYWHVHFLTGGTDTSTRYVKWEIEWNYATINGTMQTLNTTQSAEITIPPNTPAYTHILGSIYTWTPTGLTIGTHVYARLKRITAAGTAPTANPFCSMLQMHVECDTFGSRNTASK